MQALGNNIKNIRKRWGMDQVEFAEFMDLTKGMISQYERGNNDPRIPFLLRLSDLTGIPSKRLYEEEILLSEIPPEPIKGERLPVVSESPVRYKSSQASADPQKMMELLEDILRRLAALESRIDK